MKELFSPEAILPLSWIGIFTSFFCGFIIGLERQWSGKPAGIRTSILICLGAYTFVSLAKQTENIEISLRIVGQIVTGVGFLGAGVIIAKNGLVAGVTSASVIWMLAAIGCLIGFDNEQAAILIAIMGVVVLVGINLLEKVFKRLRRGVHKKFDDPE